jgi:hypothetical protein
VAEGSAQQIEALKATEIEDFYRILDLWTAQKKKEMDTLNARTR